MCFGNSQTSTQTTNSNYNPAPWLSNAAQNNLNFAGNLQSTGFQPYTGQQVADFSPQQTASFGQGQGIAGAVTPNVQTAGTSLGDFLNRTSTNPTITPESISSQMSPYMNQFVQLALNPQITAAQNQQAIDQQELQGQATSAGAFGDPRAQILQSNRQLVNDLANQGLIGNAYTAAFNTAIGAGAQDVANNLNAQIAQGNLGLGTQAQRLSGINTAFGQGVTSTNLSNTLGSQQTAQQQANLNALYNQWLIGQQYPFQTTQLVNSSLGAATPAAPSSSNSTQTTSQPNNSGWGILGSVAGAALAPFTGGLSLGLGSALGAAGNAIFGSPSSSGYLTPSQAYGSGASPVSLPNPNVPGGFISGYAEGGRPDPGQPAMVGEKGPELFVPDQRGSGGFNPAQFMQLMQSNPQLMQRLQAASTQAGGGFRPPPAGATPQLSAMPPPIQGGNLPSQQALPVVPGASIPPPNAIVQPRPLNFGGNQIANTPARAQGQQLPTRAKGGPVSSGQPTIVGENGPEVITPQQSGTVVPYDKLKAAIKKKKGVALDGLSKQLGADAA